MPIGFANAMQTSLNGGIDNSQTSITVASSTGFPTVPFRVRIREEAGNVHEICTVTNVSGTTWTVTRASELYANSSSASTHNSGAIVELILTQGALDIVSYRDKVNQRPDVAHPLDDEFRDASLDGAWVRVDNPATASNVTWTEGYSVLSMKNTGADAAANYHGLVKSLGGRSYPLTIETAIRVAGWSPNYAGYLMFGLAFADGTTYGAGKQVVLRPYMSTSTWASYTLAGYGVQNWNDEASQTLGTFGSELNYMFVGGPCYQRLIWTGANTFTAWFSPDGVSWWQFRPSTTLTRTAFTPTYVGFATTCWGINNYPIATIEYFRVYESDKAGTF